MSLDRRAQLDHLRTESARFLAAVRVADPTARVPACPDWTAAELAWHLTEVQWFWATVVEERRTDVEGLQGPARPDTYAGLLSAFAAQAQRLHEVLSSADPATEVYTWAPDRTVAFVLRRQAHEALVHRVDAEQAAGTARPAATATPVDPELASDGVHEVLDVMFGGCPSWGTFTPDDLQVEVRAADTGLVVPLVLGRFTGTDPDSGTSYDEEDLSVRRADPAAAPAATVTGTAADLDLWLWHRAEGDDPHRRRRPRGSEPADDRPRPADRLRGLTEPVRSAAPRRGGPRPGPPPRPARPRSPRR